MVMIKIGRKKGALSKLKNVEKSIKEPNIKTEITKRNRLSIFTAFFSMNCLNNLIFNIVSLT